MEKQELLDALQDGREEFIDLLDGIPETMLVKQHTIGDWSIRDVLAHLTAWEGQLVTLLFHIQRSVPGRSAEVPDLALFSGEKFEVINARWHEAGKDRPFEAIWSDFIGVRKQLIRRVNEMNEKQLNDPQLFPYLKGNSLAEYLVSVAIEHELEHADIIGEWLEQQDAHTDQ